MKHKFLTKVVIALGLLGLAAPFVKNDIITHQVSASKVPDITEFKPYGFYGGLKDAVKKTMGQEMWYDNSTLSELGLSTGKGGGRFIINTPKMLDVINKLYNKSKKEHQVLVNEHKHGYIWWCRPRKVRVTKTVRIYELDGNVPTYKRRSVKKSWLRKGSIATINHGWSYLWIVQAKGLSHRRYFWVSDTKYGWYTTNLKAKY